MVFTINWVVIVGWSAAETPDSVEPPRGRMLGRGNTRSKEMSARGGRGRPGIMLTDKIQFQAPGLNGDQSK